MPPRGFNYAPVSIYIYIYRCLCMRPPYRDAASEGDLYAPSMIIQSRKSQPRNSPKIKGGKLFYLQFELFCLQLSFFAYSSLRPLLDALSHCKQKAPILSKKAKIVSKKAPTVSKELKFSAVSKEAPLQAGSF